MGTRVLINMIIAMGAWDAMKDDRDDNGYRFYDMARQSARQAMVEEGSIQMVQGLAIMALYLQKSNKPNAGFVCLGFAIRMAIALGIHASTTSRRLPAFETEMRRRLWWSLVALENGCSLTFGRPSCLSMASVTTCQLPRNISDADLTVSDDHLPDDSEDVTLYTALIVQAHLARIVFELQNRIAHSLPSPSVEQIKWCGDRYKETVEALPPHLAPSAPGGYTLARAIQSWRTRDMWSIFYRPVMLSAEWTVSRRQNSDSNVHDIVE
jgi:transcriptional regulatory protein GAL4